MREIHKFEVLPGFLTLYIIPVEGGWQVRVNGKPVQKVYEDIGEAKYAAECGAKKLLHMANENLDCPKKAGVYWVKKNGGR